MLPLQDIFESFGYTLSLPERLVRAVAATLGGVSKLLTDTLIPEPLRQTNTYTAIVGNAQRFLIEQVAEVQGVYADGVARDLPENYVPRKIAGNILEAIGIFSVHFSPLWIFAFATDVAHGSKKYLARLVDELKANHVIAADRDIRELDELLAALADAANHTSQVFDVPPVDLKLLTDLRGQLQASYRGVFKEAGDLLPRVDRLWNRMEDTSTREGVPLESIVGLMTLDLRRTAGKAMDGVFAVGTVTTDLIGEVVLDSYGMTLDRVQRNGALACLDEAARPFVRAIASHLSLESETWTERTWRRLSLALLGETPESPSEVTPATDAVTPPGGAPMAES